MARVWACKGSGRTSGGHWSERIHPFAAPPGDFSVGGSRPYAVHLDGPALVRDLPQFPIQVDGSSGEGWLLFQQGGRRSLRWPCDRSQAGCPVGSGTEAGGSQVMPPT